MPKRALFFCALLAACAVLFCACASSQSASAPQSGQVAQASTAPACAQALSDHYWIAASPDVITRGSANSAVRLSIPELELSSGCEKWVDVCKGWREQE